MIQSLFKRQSQPTIIVDTATVEEIHHEFLTAADKALEAANLIIGNTDEHKLKLAEKLKAAGFSRSANVVQTKEEQELLEVSKNRANVIMKYQDQYPEYKFISVDDVVRICKKYGLICGQVELFTGVVPVKNAEEILKFEGRYTPKCYASVISSLEYIYGVGNKDVKKLQEALDKAGRIIYTDKYPDKLEIVNKVKGSVKSVGGNPDWIRDVRYDTQRATLEICAPPQDFETEGMEISNHFLVPSTKNIKLERGPVPDPVVLHRLPVKEKGFLIVTAWGEEANDPLVK